MRYDQKPEVGAIIYLSPHTRLAGQLEYTLSQVRVVAYDWPYVIVELLHDVSLPNSSGTITWIGGIRWPVHHLNLALHQPSRTGGDQAQQEERRVPKPLPGRAPTLILAPGEVQEPLW